MQRFLSGLIFVFALALAQSYQFANAQVVFQYEFEDGNPGDPMTLILDSGPGGLNGAGTDVFYSSDVSGFDNAGTGSLDASGDLNYGTVPDDPSMHLQEFTFRLYAKPAEPYGDEGGIPPHYVAMKKLLEEGTFITSFGIWYHPQANHYKGIVSFPGMEGLLVSSTDTFFPGQWHDVVITMNRDIAGDVDMFAIFVNGNVQDILFGEFPDIGYSDEEFSIGASNFQSDPGGIFRRNFNGWIDSIQLNATPIELAIANVSDFNVVRGFQIGGDLSSLSASDDSYLQFNPGITLNPAEPPVWLEFEGTLSGDSPFSLSFQIEANSNTVGLVQTIELFNYQTESYETVDSTNASLSDTTQFVNVEGDATRFVELGTANVKARVGWKSNGPIFIFPWTISIDHVSWLEIQ